MFRSAALLALSGVPACLGEPFLIGSFNPSEGAGMNSIGFNAATDEVFVHFNNTGTIRVYARDGAYLRSIPKPVPHGNDDDMEFAGVPITVGGTVVPANCLLVIENDQDPPRITACDHATGAVLAEQAFDAGLTNHWVGGSYSAAHGVFFVCSWTAQTIDIVDAADGAVLGGFTFQLDQAPYFYLYYGDVEFHGPTGLLYLVSSYQGLIRVLTPDGAWSGDIDAAALGVQGMSGVAFDEARGEAWVSSTQGLVYHLGGFGTPACGIADIATPFGLLDLSDITAFVSAFLAQQPPADLAPPFGLFDLRDITAFVAAFLAGCP
jgi:hypothetical protein